MTRSRGYIYIYTRSLYMFYGMMTLGDVCIFGCGSAMVDVGFIVDIIIISSPISGS